MKKLRLLLLGIIITSRLLAQLPISLYHNLNTGKPLLFYITGDGGMNKFSQSLLQTFSAQGYSIISLDAKEYFWTKKTPQQAANDVSNILSKYTADWKTNSVVLIGYSFGADVAPFIFNNASADIKNKISSLVLLSPSPTTDFEVHITNLLGFVQSDGESVVNQVNKISKRVIFFRGEDETEFPFTKLSIKNKEVIVLKGGHHYNGDVGTIAKEIISRIN